MDPRVSLPEESFYPPTNYSNGSELAVAERKIIRCLQEILQEWYFDKWKKPRTVTVHRIFNLFVFFFISHAKIKSMIIIFKIKKIFIFSSQSLRVRLGRQPFLLLYLL